MTMHALPSQWRRFLTLEPVLLRAVITALVLMLAIWGVDMSALGERVTSTIDLLYPVIVLVGAWWTRGAVTPAVQVVQSVEPNGNVIAGHASPLATGTVISTPKLDAEATVQAAGNDPAGFPYA